MQRIIGNSLDWQRIRALPRRVFTKTDVDALICAWTTALRQPNGTQYLKPHQALTLHEASALRGIVCAIGVGGGKSFLSVLLPLAMQAIRPLLLVPAALRDQTKQHLLPKMQMHWKLHNNLTIKSYAEISSAKGMEKLETLAPDLVIADEAHKLKNQKAARTKRFLRYFRNNPMCMFCALTGTLTKDSLLDYFHIVWIALKYRSPLPRHYQEAELWDLVLSPKKDNEYYEDVNPGVLWELDPISPQRGFQKRLTESPGVIMTQDTSCQSSINIHLIEAVPWYRGYYDQCKKTWELPDKEWICDAMQLWQKLNQLSVGFFHTYKETPPIEYVETRREWYRTAREFITNNRQRIDTEGTLIKYLEKTGYYPDTYRNWLEVQKRIPEPEKVSYWYDESVINFVIKLTQRSNWLIWVDSIEAGRKFEEKGLKYFGAGSSKDLLQYVYQAILPLQPIVLSIGAFGTGFEGLQRFSHNFVVMPSSSGAAWEQKIGRTHRDGQQADELTFLVLQHSPVFRDNLANAFKEAHYIQTTMGQKQKLLLSTIIGEVNQNQQQTRKVLT